MLSRSRHYAKGIKLSEKNEKSAGKNALRIVFVAVIGVCAGSAFYQYQNNRRLLQSSEPAVVYIPEPKQESENVVLVDVVAPEPTTPVDEIADVIEQIEEESLFSDEDHAMKSEAVVQTEPLKRKIILNKIEVDTPLLAIVIDDMGINQKRTKDILSLKAPLTASFLTYGKNLNELADEAARAGHEIMIHAPMEPKVTANLAPDTMKTDMDQQQIEQLFQSMLDKFQGIKVSGINNHMGSKFTEDSEKLGYVLRMLKKQNMYFLDSKTTAKSKGQELAQEEEIDFVARDVFLDNLNDYDAIAKQLRQAEQIAKKKGFAVAICHPKSQTFRVLHDWLEKYDEKQIKLVHLSEIVNFINQYQ